jgi:hypothetical protein
MSDNELININQMTDEQIMKAIGQDDGTSSSDGIPRLSINRSPEDDDGNQIPVGNFSVFDTTIGKVAYGKPVNFRPFISGMQYMHYDTDKGEYVNRSVIFSSHKDEAIDMLGGVNCGKVPYKDRDSLTPDQQMIQRTIRCYRLVYGVVSFDGVLANGEKHTVENLPTLYRVSGTAFLPLSNAIKRLKDSGKVMLKQVLSIDTERQKKGGNTFYVPVIDTKSGTELQFTKEDNDTLTVFQQAVKKENDEVIAAYKNARAKKPSDQDGEDAKVVEEMDDKLPEEVLVS